MTYLPTAENVARQIAKTVARRVANTGAKSRTRLYSQATIGFAVASCERLYTVSCDLSRNTLRYKLHEKIAQCDSAFTHEMQEV